MWWFCDDTESTAWSDSQVWSRHLLTQEVNPQAMPSVSGHCPLAAWTLSHDIQFSGAGIFQIKFLWLKIGCQRESQQTLVVFFGYSLVLKHVQMSSISISEMTKSGYARLCFQQPGNLAVQVLELRNASSKGFTNRSYNILRRTSVVGINVSTNCLYVSRPFAHTWILVRVSPKN